MRRYDAAGKRITSGTRDFKFVVAGAESILLEKELDISTPVNNQTYAYDDLTVLWSKLNYAVSYELYLEYYCGKKYHEIMTIPLDSSVNNYTIPTGYLQKGCPHRVQITARDKLGNELDVKYTFHVQGDTDVAQLSAPVITSPYIGTIKHQDTIETIPEYEDIAVTWTNVKAAQFYSLELIDLEDNTNVSLVGETMIAGNQFVIPVTSLKSGHRYSVSIFAHHTEECYKMSDEGYFRAPYPGNKTLNPPQLITPELSDDPGNPTTMYYQNIKFTWAEETAAATYNISFSIPTDDITFYKELNLTTTSVTVPYNVFYDECFDGDVVRLSLTATDADGQWACKFYYITFTNSPISKPVLTFPVLPTDKNADFPAHDEDEDLTVFWDAVPEAIKYEVILREYFEGDWDDLLVLTDITNTTVVIPDDYFYIGGKFQLRIRAVNAYGAKKVSDRYYFQIGSSDYIGVSIPATGASSWTPSYKAAHKYVNVNTVGNWTAVVSAPWLSVSQANGNGCTSVKIDIQENADVFARTGYVTFTNSYSGTAVFIITQAPNGTSNEGALIISNPSQGESVEKSEIMAKWSYRYDCAYFNVELKNLCTNLIVYQDTINITPVSAIPSEVLTVGESYLLTVYVYNYSEICVNQSSVTFKVEKSDIAEGEETPITTTWDTSSFMLITGESYVFSGRISSSVPLDKLHISIVRADNPSVGIDYYRTEKIGANEFDLSAVAPITAGTVLAGLQITNTQESLPLTDGPFSVNMWITDVNGNSSGRISKTVTVMSTSSPIVSEVQVTPVSGTISDTYTFTAQATGTDKVAFYVDTYHLDTVTGVNGVFTFSHSAFTATGNRTVYAYPCDAAGQPIMTEGSYASAVFTIAQAPRLGPVTITSSSYRTSLINTAVDLNWIAPSNAPGDTRYNIYVYSDGSQVGTVITTTALSCVIPADYFTQEGEYMLEVLAAAEGWESGSSRAVTVSVRTAQPTLDDFALDRTTVSLDGSIRLSGFINGNGGLIAKVTVTVLNTDINDGGTIWTNQSLNVPYFDLSAVPALAASNPAFKGAGNYKVRVFVKMQGAEDADMLGNASLSVLTDARSPLVAPVVTGSESVTAGDNYQLSWIPVANADYYELTIDGTSYKEIIEGNTATIPGKTLKNLTGAQTATTLKLRLVAHSNDTDTWLPSSAAVKTITVLPEVQSRAMILGVTMKNYTVVAGTAAEFTVTTTTDVTAIRMKDGAGSFIIGTWNTGYVDKNGERIWTVTQQINDPGVNNQRVLTFYSMIGDTEYNKCDVGFTCVVTAAIGSFEIVSPAHESKQAEKHDLSITWNAPANVAVDYYIVRVYHGEACVLQQEVPAQNPAPVVIPGALLVRDNEAYQVRITARKTGHAESTAVSRFTLICPHENTYQPVEKTTYTNTGSASLHRFVQTISYTCADCGRKNLETEPETGTGSHNWVDLNNGGRVCNFCWYMEGVVADTKEYKFIGGSQNRTVYMNVDASGEPYGVQKNEDGVDRQVFETDVITILGNKGNSALIRYPVGQSGYHFGFMKRTYFTTDEMVEFQSPDALRYDLVKSAVDRFFAANSSGRGFGICSNEYTLADQILAKNNDNSVIGLFLEYIRHDITDKIVLAFDFSNMQEKDMYRAMVYAILDNVITEPENLSEYTQKILNNIENADSLDDIKANLELVRSSLDLPEEIAELYMMTNGNTYTGDLFVDVFVEIGEQLHQGSNAALACQNMVDFLQDHGETTGTIGFGIAKIAIDYYSVSLTMNRTTFETIQLLREAFTQITVSDEEQQMHKEMLLSIVDEIELAFQDNIYSALPTILSTSQEIIAAEATEMSLDAMENLLKNVPGVIGKSVGGALSLIGWYDFWKGILFEISGLNDYLDAVNDTFALLPLSGAIDVLYLDYVNKYRTYGFNQQDYYNFYALHNMIQGVQITLNQIAAKLTDNTTELAQLKNEIEHLRHNTLSNWEYNPYSTISIDYPDLSKLSNDPNGTEKAFECLLTGADVWWMSYDGLLGRWNEMSLIEKSFFN